PRVAVRGEYDAPRQRYTLHVQQSCPPTPGQPEKSPFVIPLAVGLLGAAGNLPLRLAGTPAAATAGEPESAGDTHLVLQVRQASQRFVFEGVTEQPVPSLLRGFSAPVRLDYDYSRRELCALMSRDDDGFVRWDSAQTLAVQVIQEVEVQLRGAQPVAVDTLLLEACAALLRDHDLDPAMVAAMLQLPGENYLAELASHGLGADVDSLHSARENVRRAIATHCADDLLKTYRRLSTNRPYEPSAQQIAARSLRNSCLDLLACNGEAGADLAIEQYASAGNMTDRLAALQAVAFYGGDEARHAALASFYTRWQRETLAVNQWFQVQATMPDAAALERVRSLLSHPDFDLRNPNKVRALVGAFVAQNPVNFHRIDGAGYRFLSDIVMQLDSSNPQIAARLLLPLTRWRNYVGRAELMRAQLERLAAQPSLSPDVYEVVSKSLQ
ncbi:MAG: DUF3458 domain-containing protein, partial [Halioglobus sp.]|nr:DUF3458 domain-containing protein [Halioglobus sp.]